MPTSILVENLSHRFSKKAEKCILSEINFHFHTSKIIGVVGPDGAGKTTLLRILTGLMPPEKGNVILDGINLYNQAPIPSDLIRYMPQKFGLYEDLTVEENFHLYADLNELSHKEKAETIPKLLAFTHLNPFQKRLARHLSGGMKQKLGLACTLINQPKILILDEPTVGVDPISRLELWKMINNLSENGMTIIVSTSYLDEINYVDSVLILNEGICLYQGIPQSIKEAVQNRSFFIQNLKEPKRKLLNSLLAHPSVLDGLIQGDSLKILTYPDQQALFQSIASDKGTVTSSSPSFEDGFMNLIPAHSQHLSPIGHLYPTFEKLDHPLVEAKNLKKQFGSFLAVNEISFEVSQGEIFGLLGPNGAGKSTTFKMLCGLLKPSSGTAKIKNLSFLDAPSLARAKIGYMAQKFSLYSDMTVLQNLQFFYGIYPRYQQKNHIIEEMIETFYLKPYLSMRACDLPLGFKQRLALACSIMHRPEVLFLDEPTSGVDPITRREFWSHINALVEKNVAIVVTTHFMDEAEYCDRIGLIDSGQLIAIGTPDQLKSQAQSQNTPLPTLEEAFIYLTRAEKNKIA